MTAWIELKNLAPNYWRLVSVLGNNFEYITTASRIHYNTLSWLMSCTVVAVIVLLRVVGHFRIIYFSVLTSHRMTAKLFSVSKSFLDVSDKKIITQMFMYNSWIFKSRLSLNMRAPLFILSGQAGTGCISPQPGKELYTHDDKTVKIQGTLVDRR